MHNKLGFHKVCTRWVPKQFTEVHKQTRMEICQKHLDRYGYKWDIFLDRIITGDETWIHHYKPGSKWQSMEWKHPQSPYKKSSKPNHPQENWCLQCFGTHKAQYWNIIRRGGHNNKQCALQWDAYRQAEACSSKQMPKGVVLSHDTAHPHCWNTPET